MNRLKIIILCVVLSSISHPALSSTMLTIYTEEVPPYNFTDKGRFTGVSTEVAIMVFKLAGYDYKFISQPWARSYQMVQQEPGSLIFSISRRENREKLFRWIGILVPSTHSVYALKKRSDIQVNQLGDLKKFTIGTIIKDAREAYLQSKGFKLEDFSRVGGDMAFTLNYRKLKLGRVDVVTMPDAVINHVAKKDGDDPGEVLRRVMVLSEISVGGYYIAANLQTSDEVVDRLKTALELFKQTSGYKKILRDWGL